MVGFLQIYERITNLIAAGGIFAHLTQQHFLCCEMEEDNIGRLQFGYYDNRMTVGEVSQWSFVN